MQLMLLEQQNKKRLLMARQEQNNRNQMPPPPPPGGETPLAGHTFAEDNANGKVAIVSGPSHISESSSTETELLGLLDDDFSSMDVEELRNYMASLQSRAKRIKRLRVEAITPAYRYQLLYRIQRHQPTPSRSGRDKIEKVLSPPYLDPPEQLPGLGGPPILRCQIPLTNLDLFLEQNKDISFIVYQTYVPSSRGHLQDYLRRIYSCIITAAFLTRCDMIWISQ